ncbi:MAG: hypothetical protein JXR15_07310 [Shimia sp.]|uniref:hypothetical protein n=1 Tax=Shimia sp. TaxID=1954381 RepID=UPI003B8C6CD2
MKARTVVTALSLVAGLPQAVHAEFSKEQLEVQIAEAGKFEWHDANGNLESWTRTEISNCQLTLKTFKFDDQNSVYLFSSDMIDVRSFGLNDADEKTGLNVTDLTRSTPEAKMKVIYVGYVLKSGEELVRTLPMARANPEKSYEVGPVIEGRQYVIGSRSRGGFMATEPSTLEPFEEWLDAIEIYAKEYCETIS